MHECLLSVYSPESSLDHRRNVVPVAPNRNFKRFAIDQLNITVSGQGRFT